MPSNVAVLRNLTFTPAGSMTPADLQNFPRVFWQLVEGGPDATPETGGSDYPLIGTDGQFTTPRRARRLVITLEGSVAGAGATEAAQRSDTAAARQEMRVLFDPTAGIGLLSVDTEDGSTWTIPARPELLSWDREPAVPTWWGGIVRLIAVDPPYWTESGS